MKLCEYVDLCLNKVGVDKVFGIPGSLIMPIWQNITNKEIILCSHEQEASYVATGYAKITRKPVCVITTGGPGVTNCLSGIASANIDSVPLIFLSGRTPIGKEGYGLRQEESNYNRLYDSTNLLKSVTKVSVCVNDINSAPQIIWNAINAAVEQRRGAIHISIPIDLQNEEIIEPEISALIKNSPIFTDHTLINKKTLFIIGWGSWMSDAYGKIFDLAELVNAPVLVSSKAYCCACDSRMFLGKMGYGYNREIDDFINEYDPESIVVFGSSLGEKDIKNTVLVELIEKIPTYVIADDCSFFSVRKTKVIPIETNDMKCFVGKMIECAGEYTINKKLNQRIQQVKTASLAFWKSRILPTDLMAKCIEYINHVLNDATVVFADAGNNLANTGALIMPSKSGQMFLDVGLRAMGTGICTSVGMAIADNTKKYISITGDGCMLMNGNVMHLAAEKNLPIVFIVFNNHSLGRVRVGQTTMNDYRGTDINDVDFIKYGQVFGIMSQRCESLSEFKEILSRAINFPKPYLIEVVTGNNEIPVFVKDNIY